MASQDVFSDDVLTDPQIVTIADSMLQWRSKASILDMDDSEIENIKEDNRDSNKMQKIALLKRWKGKYGDRATFSTLAGISDGDEWVLFIKEACKKFGFTLEAEDFKLTVDKVRSFMKKEMFPVASSETLAEKLKIPEERIEEMKRKNDGNDDDLFDSVIDVWLHHTEPAPSWEMLVEALKSGGHRVIATKMKVGNPSVSITGNGVSGSFSCSIIRWVISCLFVFLILLTVIWMILTILLLTTIPHSLMGNTQKIVFDGIVPLFSNIRKEWLEAVDIRLTTDVGNVERICPSWNVSIVNSSNCSSLPVQSCQSNTDIDTPCNIFALRGSTFNVTVPDNVSVIPPNIWFSHSIEARMHLDEQICSPLDDELLESCRERTPARTCDKFKEQNNDMYSCVSAGDYRGRSYIFTVSAPGFYCYFLTNSEDNVRLNDYEYGIQISFTTLTYNHTAIVNKYHPRELIAQEEDSLTGIQVSKFFNYNTIPCVLLGFSCDNNYIATYSIENLRRRKDTIYLLLLSYLALVSAGILIFCVLGTVKIILKRNKKTLCL